MIRTNLNSARQVTLYLLSDADTVRARRTPFSLPPLLILLSVTLGASILFTPRFEGLPKSPSQGNPVENSQHQKAGGITPARNSAPAPAVQSKALPLEWLLDPDKSSTLTDRILARLIQCEAHEPDVWLRDDYRQAFIAVSFAARGIPEPFVEASYVMYGLHPEKLYPAILARRSALLGSAGEAAPHRVNPGLPGSSPKKPSGSVKPRKEDVA